MKENNEPVLVTTVKSTIDAQKSIIDKAHEEIMREVKGIAADLAVRSLPDPQSASLEEYIEPIRARYSGLLNDNSLEFSNSVRNQLGALDIHSLRQEAKEAKLKSNAAGIALKDLKDTRKKSIGQRTPKEYKKLDLSLNIFTVIEILGYILSFMALGDNYILAAVWGMLLGVGQTTGIKSLVLYMRDGSGAALSMLQKRLIWIGVAVVATGLGLLRYATIQGDGATGLAQSALAPFIFILISYFLISVLALYVWHNYPTNEEQANMKRAVGLDDEIAAKEIEFNGLEEQIKKLTANCNTIAQVHTLLIHAGKDFYHRINNHFLYAVGIFKSTNRISRNDNINPECFSQPVLPLAIPNYDAWDKGEIDTNPINDNV